MEIITEYLINFRSFFIFANVVVLVIACVNFFYRVFQQSYANGFLRERSLDISSISLFSLVLYPVITILLSSRSVLEFIIDPNFSFSTVSILIATYIYSKVKKLSFLKIFDILSKETSLFYALVSGASVLISLSISSLIASLGFLYLFLILRALQKQKFRSFMFGVLKSTKSDEVSFIGGLTQVFLIYQSSLAILIMSYNKVFNTIILIGYIIVLVYSIIKFFNLSKSNKIIWTLHLSLFKKKNLSLKEKSSSRKLID